MKISLSRLASCRHFVSVPLRRTPRASASNLCERFDFGLQLGDRAGGRGLVKNLFFGGGDLFLGRVFQVLNVFCGEFRTGRRDKATGLSATLKHLEFTQTALQTLASPAQRSVDRLGRRRQPTLDDSQGKTDRAGSPVILKRLGPVELLAHILGHLRVQARLVIGKLVGHGIGDALGKKRGRVKLEQVFFHHAAHQVGHIGRMHAVTKATLETVAVEEGHEELEVFLFAVMRRGRHQQKVTGQAGQQLAQAVALGVVDLTAKEGRRHLMRLVTHDQVPATIRGLKLMLYVFIARQLVQASDNEIGLHKPVAGPARLRACRW